MIYIHLCDYVIIPIIIGLVGLVINLSNLFENVKIKKALKILSGTLLICTFIFVIYCIVAKEQEETSTIQPRDSINPSTQTQESADTQFKTNPPASESISLPQQSHEELRNQKDNLTIKKIARQDIKLLVFKLDSLGIKDFNNVTITCKGKPYLGERHLDEFEIEIPVSSELNKEDFRFIKPNNE